MPEDFEQLAPSADPELEGLLEADARAGMCPPPDLLFAAQEDVLPADAGASIRAHAEHCMLCQTLLEGLAPTELSLSPGQKARIRARVQADVEATGPTRAVPAPAARKPTLWDYAPIAAVVLLTFGSVLTFRLMRHPAAQGVAEKPPAAAIAPAQSVDIAELHAVAALPPPDGAVLATRGAAESVPSTVELLPAFRAYNRGEFTAAAAAFVPVAARYPKASVPALYLGVTQLQLNDNEAARTTLSRARDLASPSQREATAWFLAIADLRTGHTEDAVHLLQLVCDTSGSGYSSRACVLAKQAGTAKVP